MKPCAGSYQGPPSCLFFSQVALTPDDSSQRFFKFRILPNPKSASPFFVSFLFSILSQAHPRGRPPVQAEATSGRAWVAAGKFMISTSYAWRRTWNGMRPVSSAVNAKSSWTRSALASCVTGKSSARRTTSGKYLLLGCSHKSR